ncbi:unnamed protein product [Chrysodeixis includens]|uniref:Uncharacterized protein n=1 Tax=Chrysodeixis includens TaxID=689277 RepID=A0A9N8KYL0_CHRIL|nr:unnamed protein product [Chrysodeixis includens]
MVGEKRFVWARNATVAFARGIQQRLARPGRYALADGMLRLSDIILDEICGYMHMRTPSRRCSHPKAKFMMEMSDKVAVWIDEILSESDDRMLMMDFDEDDEVERFFEDAARPEGQPPEGAETPLAAPPAADTEAATPGNATPSAETPAESSAAATPGETPAETPAATPTATSGEQTPSQAPPAAGTPPTAGSPRTSGAGLKKP